VTVFLVSMSFFLIAAVFVVAFAAVFFLFELDIALCFITTVRNGFVVGLRVVEEDGLLVGNGCVRDTLFFVAPVVPVAVVVEVVVVVVLSLLCGRRRGRLLRRCCFSCTGSFVVGWVSVVRGSEVSGWFGSMLLASSLVDDDEDGDANKPFGVILVAVAVVAVAVYPVGVVLAHIAPSLKRICLGISFKFFGCFTGIGLRVLLLALPLEVQVLVL
jgi:hypothetical protein